MADYSCEADTFDLEAYENRQAERYNASPGKLNQLDCRKCMNRGNFMRIVRTEYGLVENFEPCECMAARRGLDRLKRSGLEEGVKRCRLDNYSVRELWQSKILELAHRYLADDGDSWFFVGGAVGSGKTHICTAICGQYMARMPVQYAIWPEELQALMAGRFDSAEYSPRMNWLKNVDLLYIDDFFKISADKNPSATEIRIAHELLNHRYVARKRTIISSERYSYEITEIDQATGGRIAERSAGYTINIGRDKAKDYRMRLAGDLL